MQRLSGLDASFLYMETRSQLMHVTAVLEIDPATVPGGYTFEKLRDALETQIAAMPNFRRKLDNSLLNVDHPVWIEDDDFDIQRHVHRIAVPEPGGPAEVTELVGHLAGQTLDRGKPLWEMWVIEEVAGGRIAVVLRMHHANIDGVTSAEMLAQLCTLTPEPPEPDPEKLAQTAGGASHAAMAVAGAVNFFVQRPIAMAKLLPRTVSIPFAWARRAREDDAMPAPFQAPRTRFNGPLTPHRSLALTQVPLTDIKKIKNCYGVKINDVVLALVGGSVRSYLESHDELPESPLVAMVPVSVHGADETGLLEPGTNKVTGMFTQLPTDVADPADRLQRAAEMSRKAKGHHADIDANILRAWAQFAPGTTLANAMKLYGDRKLADKHPAVFNVLVSNVAGPDAPMYFLGAKLTAVYPLGPIFHGLGLNITVFSADGNLNVGFVACTDQTPDVWQLARDFDQQVVDLLDCCGRDG